MQHINAKLAALVGLVAVALVCSSAAAASIWKVAIPFALNDSAVVATIPEKAEKPTPANIPAPGYRCETRVPQVAGVGEYVFIYSTASDFTEPEAQTGEMARYTFEPIGQFENNEIHVLEQYDPNGTGAGSSHVYDGYVVQGDADGFGGFVSDAQFQVSICGVWPPYPTPTPNIP